LNAAEEIRKRVDLTQAPPEGAVADMAPVLDS
jgi:hypothetical protein